MHVGKRHAPHGSVDLGLPELNWKIQRGIQSRVEVVGAVGKLPEIFA
jgi:hypothetical protein